MKNFYFLLLFLNISLTLHSTEEYAIGAKLEGKQVKFSVPFPVQNPGVLDRRWREISTISFNKVWIIPSVDLNAQGLRPQHLSIWKTYPETVQNLTSPREDFPSEEQWQKALSTNNPKNLSTLNKSTIFSSDIARGLIGGGILLVVLGISGFLYYKFYYKDKSLALKKAQKILTKNLSKENFHQKVDFSKKERKSPS